MLFVAGLSWKYILSVLALIPPAAIVAWNFFLDDDKKNRILAVINPALVDEPLLAARRSASSPLAGAGGLWGNGIFMESGQFALEVYNDFIFTYIGEAVGFIGSVAVQWRWPFVHRGLCSSLRAADMGKYLRETTGMITVQIIHQHPGMCWTAAGHRRHPALFVGGRYLDRHAVSGHRGGAERLYAQRKGYAVRVTTLYRKGKEEPKMRKPLVGAVIAAGGMAQRMQGIDKQQLVIGGVPVLARSILALGQVEQVGEIGGDKTRAV